MEQTQHFDVEDSVWASCLAQQSKSPAAVRGQVATANTRESTGEAEQFKMRKTSPRIVLVGGSTTPGTTAQSVLNHVAQLVREMNGLPEVFDSSEIDLPMFAPESPARTSAALRLIESLRASDGVILVGASCHGTISGMLKNALDYAEDMVRDPSPYFDGRPVGLIATESASREMGGMMMSLRSVVHALRGWPTPLGITITGGTVVFDRDGNCVQPDLAKQMRVLAQQVMGFARNADDIGATLRTRHLQDANI